MPHSLSLSMSVAHSEQPRDQAFPLGGCLPLPRGHTLWLVLLLAHMRCASRASRGAQFISPEVALKLASAMSWHGVQ